MGSLSVDPTVRSECFDRLRGRPQEQVWLPYHFAGGSALSSLPINPDSRRSRRNVLRRASLGAGLCVAGLLACSPSNTDQNAVDRGDIAFARVEPMF